MSTISSVMASSQFQKVFLEPFKQGASSIRDGFSGKRIESVILPGALLATNRQVNLSLAKRVTAVVLGTLLLVPIVNAVVMQILKAMNSQYLHEPVRRPVQLPPVTIPVTTNAAATTTTPVTQPITIVPVIPPTLTKEQAVTRMGQLDAMGANIADNFDVTQVVSTFDLDAILNRLTVDQNPSRLCDLINWSGLDNGQVRARHGQMGKQDALRTTLQEYDANGADQHAVIKTQLSKLNSYFAQRRATVVAGSNEETALKAQFIAIADKINDASNNCINQMLAQVQEIMLDISGDMIMGANAGNEHAAFQIRAGQILCAYRANLVRQICVRQNPTENHMADLERAVMQRLAPMLGINGAIFNIGARYNIVNDLDNKVNRAANAFLGDRDRGVIAEYQPVQYFAAELRTATVDPMLKLRNDLCAWTVGGYTIGDEDEDNVQPNDVNPHLSANFTPGAFTDFANGGEWSRKGTYLVLESAGLISRR